VPDFFDFLELTSKLSHLMNILDTFLSIGGVSMVAPLIILGFGGLKKLVESGASENYLAAKSLNCFLNRSSTVPPLASFGLTLLRSAVESC
jgi:hypothetical protein